ncbi:MAG TPA: hypothetical protein VM283_04985, partial [Armatimonadota bacterium]|nr:hypothetical protein [Armatimonadota bacterium]
MWLRIAFVAIMTALATCARAQAPANDIVVDDFEADTLDHWQNSVSPEYYRGGEGNEALSIVDDPERGRVMSAAIGFGDPNKSEAVWITRSVEQPIPLARIVSASFWYKITGATESPLDSLKLRLRTSPEAFTDYEVLPEGGAPLGQWTQVTVPVREGMPARNIYRYIFGEVQQVTLRLDDVDDRNARFALLVDDIRVTLDQPRVESYQPTKLDLRRDERLDVLVIRHSAAGYYDIEGAARALDPSARVDTYLFRGLHFPLWGFPEGVENLLGYDVIVLVDVDPWVMTAEQAQWIADLAHSGAGLVVFGGPNTLTHAHEFKLPLREALPVSFEPGAKEVGGGVPAAADHPLAAALPATGLGSVPAMHDLALREGAQAVFTVGDRPLVACGSFGEGRVAVVNCWPSYALPLRSRFLTSDLGDDLRRSLLRWAWGHEPAARLTSLELPPRTVIAPGAVTVGAAAEGASRIRLIVAGQPEQTAPANEPVNFTVDLPEQTVSDRTLACRVEALGPAGEVTDWRDFEIDALAPLGVEVAWAGHQDAFAPGGPVQFSVQLSLRGMPALTPSTSSVNLSFADGALPVSCSGLADVWVVPAGTDKVLHDQLGPDDVKTTEAREGLLQTITTTGITRAGREDMTFGEDNRIQRVERVAEVQPDGAVRVASRYEFLQDVQVSRITTMLVLPASAYAGLPFVVEQGGERVEGELPAADGKKVLDGSGLTLTVETPSGPLRIEVLDASLHVWMQDLRRYGSDSFRIEIESPFEGKLARRGDSYEVPVLVSGPAVGNVPLPAVGDLSLRCEVLDPASGEAVMSWPARSGTDDLTFLSELPNLRSGEYELAINAVQGDRVVSSVAEPCFVVDPLDRANFFPIMTVLGERGGGQEMDRAMALARLDDIIAHGFNAITAGNARSYAQPSASHTTELCRDLATQAQRLGLATFFEYHRLTLVGSDPVEPCVFDPAHREKLREYLEPQLDVCRRVPRLLSIKILDEPSMAAKNLDLCDRCRARFRELYGADLAGPDEVGEDIAARWRL